MLNAVKLLLLLTWLGGRLSSSSTFENLHFLLLQDLGHMLFLYYLSYHACINQSDLSFKNEIYYFYHFMKIFFPQISTFSWHASIKSTNFMNFCYFDSCHFTSKV